MDRLELLAELFVEEGVVENRVHAVDDVGILVEAFFFSLLDAELALDEIIEHAFFRWRAELEKFEIFPVFFVEIFKRNHCCVYSRELRRGLHGS